MNTEQQHLYPAGVNREIDVAQYSSLVELMDVAFAKHARSNAYTFSPGFTSSMPFHMHS